MPHRDLHRELIEVDPHHIKFNPSNPRKHLRTEFLRLKKSIDEIGVVQAPTVRVLSGGFYECIDGEGRVQAAQEVNLKSMPVVSVGVIDDQEALMMLQAANTVRSFNFLTECRGLANLHRQGLSSNTLAQKFGEHPSIITKMTGIGYFPDTIYSLILDNIAQSEEDAAQWSPSLLYELLPLRQELPQPANKEERLPPRERYTYKEVQIAVGKVISKEITSVRQMMSYVTEWRLAFFQKTFDQVLEEKLKQEIQEAQRTLQQSHEEALQEVEQQMVNQYRSQVETLESELNDLQQRYTTLLRDVAKQPETVKLLENDLRQQLERTKAERTRLQTMQQEVQRETKIQHRQFEEYSREKLEADRQEQQTKLKSMYAQREADLNALYARKERELEIKAQTTIQQIIAQGVKTLVEAQQWTLHLVSPEVLKGLQMLSTAEAVALRAQIQALREVLEKAEEKLLHGDVVETERRSYDGYQSFR